MGRNLEGASGLEGAEKNVVEEEELVLVHTRPPCGESTLHGDCQHSLADQRTPRLAQRKTIEPLILMWCTKYQPSEMALSKADKRGNVYERIGNLELGFKFQDLALVTRESLAGLQRILEAIELNHSLLEIPFIGLLQRRKGLNRSTMSW